MTAQPQSRSRPSSASSSLLRGRAAQHQPAGARVAAQLLLQLDRHPRAAVGGLEPISVIASVSTRSNGVPAISCSQRASPAVRLGLIEEPEVDPHRRPFLVVNTCVQRSRRRPPSASPRATSAGSGADPDHLPHALRRRGDRAAPASGSHLLDGVVDQRMNTSCGCEPLAPAEEAQLDQERARRRPRRRAARRARTAPRRCRPSPAGRRGPAPGRRPPARRRGPRARRPRTRARTRR